MQKEAAIKLWQDAKYIFAQSRLPDVRRKARDIALALEKEIGDLPFQSAEHWSV